MSRNIAQIQNLDLLFQDLPSRLSIIKSDFGAENDNLISIKVHRNHVFETFEDVLKKYLCFSGLETRFEYSEYDDSFLFSPEQSADIHIIWIDFSRYGFSAEEKTQWLNSRLQALRDITSKPIVLAALELDTTSFSTNVANVLVVDLSYLQKKLGDGFIDERRMAVTGGRLSDKASTLIAREIAFKYIAPLYNKIKAVVVDLDNTLYEGVLGEDGINGVKLTDAHRLFQKKLKELKEQGVFLSILSKNHHVDAENLFKNRDDFVLKWEDFTTTHINWESKGKNILDAIQTLRIAQESVLFFDDNIGELIDVSSHAPNVRLFPAHNTEILPNVIELYPGLRKNHVLKEDALRQQDLQANALRGRMLQSTSSKEEYFKQLNMHIDFFINPSAQIARLADLSNKTNQFNLAFRRYSEDDIKTILDNPTACIVSFSLKDILADSGIIGVIIGMIEGDALTIKELCVSCRALGRDIENLMIHKSIDVMRSALGPASDTIAFDYMLAPRNQPALDFLGKFTGQTLDAEETIKNIQALFTDVEKPSEDHLSLVIHKGEKP